MGRQLFLVSFQPGGYCAFQKADIVVVAFGLAMMLGEILDDSFDFTEKWNESILEAEESKLFILQAV